MQSKKLVEETNQVSQPTLPDRKPNGVGRPKSGTFSVDSPSAIIETALELFAERGCQAVSTKDIAARVGFNTALIYYYFHSKEELFSRTVLLAIERAKAPFQTLYRRRLPVRDFTTQWIDLHINHLKDLRQLAKLLVDYAAMDKIPAVDEAVSAFRQDMRAMLDSKIRDGLEADEQDPAVADDLIAMLTLFVDGVSHRSLVLPGFDPTPELDLLKTFVTARIPTTKRRLATAAG